MIQCPRCHQQNNPNAATCAYCGYTLHAAQSPYGAASAEWAQPQSASPYATGAWAVDPASAYPAQANPAATYGSPAVSAQPAAPFPAQYPAQGSSYADPSAYPYQGYGQGAASATGSAYSPATAYPQAGSYAQAAQPAASPYGQAEQYSQQYSQSAQYGHNGQQGYGQQAYGQHGAGATPSYADQSAYYQAQAGAQPQYGQQQYPQYPQPQATPGAYGQPAYGQPAYVPGYPATAPTADVSTEQTTRQAAAQAFPGTGQASQFPAPAANGMPAQALLESSGLPAWMGGQAASAPAASESPIVSSGGLLSASALIDEQSLPQWLRGAGQEPSATSASTGATGAFSSPVATSGASANWPTLGTPSTASAPVSPVSPGVPGLGLPTPGQYPGAQASPIAGAGAASFPGFGAAPMTYQATANGAQSPWAMPGQAAYGAAAAPASLGASQLVDDSALPAWLRGQQGTPLPATSPVAPMGAAAYDLGQSPEMVGSHGAMSASDLVDPAALPWSGQPAAPASGASPASGWMQQPQAPTWGVSPTGGASGTAPAEQPAWLQSAQGAPAGAGSSAPFASDHAGSEGARQTLREEELPAWLRSPAQSPSPQPPQGQQGQYGQAAGAQPGTWGQGAYSAQQQGYPQQANYPGYAGYPSSGSEGSAGYGGGAQYGGFSSQYPENAQYEYGFPQGYEQGGYPQGAYPQGGYGAGYGDDSWQQEYDDAGLEQPRKKGRKFGFFRR